MRTETNSLPICSSANTCDPSKAPGSIHRFIPTAHAALLLVHVQGTAALYITLTKVHEHFWDALVEPSCASALGNRLKFDLGRWYSSLGASALTDQFQVGRLAAG